MDAPTTRSKLLEAACAVFLEHGYSVASMDQVRQEAGVSNGSLYHHFPTKAQLADALYAHTLQNFHSVLLSPVTGRATAQSGVKGLIRMYIRWVLQHPDKARLLHELRRSADVAGGAQISAANEDGFGTLKKWIAQRVAAGDMRELPFAVWMALVFSPAIALTPHWVRQTADPAAPAVSPKVRAALEHAAWMAVAA